MRSVFTKCEHSPLYPSVGAAGVPLRVSYNAGTDVAVSCGFTLGRIIALCRLEFICSFANEMAVMTKLLDVFRRRRPRQRRVVAPAVTSDPEPRLYDADAAGESYFGDLSTFSEVFSDNGPRRGDLQVLSFQPFFGPFAGRKVTFELEKAQARTTVYVDSVRISVHVDLAVGKGSVRDRCIVFLHPEPRYELQLQCNLPPPQPPTLKFLCRQHIKLNGKLPTGTPKREADQFDSTAKQVVEVRVWPSNERPRSLSERATALSAALRVRVPVHLSYGELTYFVRQKLGLPVTYSIHFHEPDGVCRLEPSRPIEIHTNTLECFVQSPQRLLTSPPPCLLPVLLVGTGLCEIEVSCSTTVLELEAAIMDFFNISRNIFLYIPALFSSQLSEALSLRMFTNANRQVAMALLDRQHRRFPIVSDDDPHLQVDHCQLPLYHLTLAEIGLLRMDSPLLCFDVTGPTVPLKFRAFSMTPGGANYMLLTEEVRVLSINPNWTASTLVKYVSSMSMLSFRALVRGNSTIPKDQVLSQLFARDWIVTHPSGRKAVSPSVLKCV